MQLDSAETELVTASDQDVLTTFDRMIRERVPNLFRLFINPYVAQACYCLTRYVLESWPETEADKPFQVYLANSVEEALSGAVKLTRYVANATDRPTRGLIIDQSDRFKDFAFTDLADERRIRFLPEVETVADPDIVLHGWDGEPPPGFLVVPHNLLQDADGPLHRLLVQQSEAERPRLIVYTDRGQLSLPGSTTIRPDIVLFDESFANHDVPFGAFAARQDLCRRWNKRGMAQFHSTTFQPNTVSCLHFMRCVQSVDPDFFARHQAVLNRLEHDYAFRFEVFARLYNRSLANLTARAGFADETLRAAGHSITVSGRTIFDGVAGIACSIRGHNPPDYAAELADAEEAGSCREELRTRLCELTGLPHCAPAVSGAAAVELALKLGLAGRHPRNTVLALRGGYGGKMLFSLTGTADRSLRAGLDPLYPHVVYVDPFSSDAREHIQAAFREHRIAVAQIELVQGVGGVRALDADVLQCLVDACRNADSLLFVDEIQTGMYRTGPFVRSTEVGIRPDLLTIGKGTSAMMFPFAATIFSDRVQQKLEESQCAVAESAWSRFGYETGIRTTLNTVRRAEEGSLEDHVRRTSELFRELLDERLKRCPIVRDVRCFGLLIGIELNTRRPVVGELFAQLYLLAMTRHPTFPVLLGYCQYEPNVLKLTPPLSVTESEVRNICETIATVLGRSRARVAAAGLRHAVRSEWKRLCVERTASRASRSSRAAKDVH